MSEEKKEELRKLVAHYLSERATPEERKVLEDYYELFNSGLDIIELLPEVQLEALRLRMKSNISRALDKKETKPLSSYERKPLFSYEFLKMAVAVIVLVGIGWLLRTNSDENETTPIPAEQTLSEASPRKVNRFMTLPDGSTVILHSGSNIKLADDFNQSTRTIFLTGEAYFDIAHNQKTPFVIRTGKLKTVVLGTAFNVRAWPNDAEITVSVARGKVRVEDEEGVLAILTPDKNLTYNTESSETNTPEAPVSDAINWLQEEMTFDEMPFGELASRLGERYGTAISFDNPELANCEITGRFNGTETLNEVLRTLSIASNTQFTYTEEGVVIAGDKCM